jgi:hypothetical protein
MMLTVPDRCPECGSTEVARIVYGYPSGNRREPNTVDGGCRCWGDERDPKWACQGCGVWFGEVIQICTAPSWEPNFVE